MKKLLFILTLLLISNCDLGQVVSRRMREQRRNIVMAEKMKQYHFDSIFLKSEENYKKYKHFTGDYNNSYKKDFNRFFVNHLSLNNKLFIDSLNTSLQNSPLVLYEYEEDRKCQNRQYKRILDSINNLWYSSEEYNLYKHKQEKQKNRQALINKIKSEMENFFNYWLFYIIYIIANLGVFQMNRYIRSGIKGSATPIIEISMIVLNIAAITALVIFGFKTVWYYPIILYVLGWIVGELLYLILRKLFGEWNPLVWSVIALISTIILYIVLFSPNRDYSLPKDECYICTGEYSKAYHIRKKCKGLKHCGGDVLQVKIQRLPDRYKNHPCVYCNKK